MAFVSKYLSEAEFTSFVVIHCSDHCSTMTSAASKAKRTFVGDAPHATALVIKAILSMMGLREGMMLARKIFARKNSLMMKQLLKGFGVKRELFAMPLTRWACWPRMLVALSSNETLASLQQILLFLLSKVKTPKNGKGRKKAKPVEEEFDPDVDTWHDGIAHQIAADDEDDQEEESMTPARLTAATRVFADDLEELLDFLTDASWLCRVRCACILTEPLRAANAKMQTSHMSADALGILAGVWTHLKKFTDKEARDIILKPAKSAITDSRKSTTAPALYAEAEEKEGVVVVVNKADIMLPSYQPLAGTTSQEKAVVDKQVWDAQLQAVGLAMTAVEKPYNKWVQPLVYRAEMRHLAALHPQPITALAPIGTSRLTYFEDLLECDEAFPTAAPGDDENPDDDSEFDGREQFTWAPSSSGAVASTDGSGMPSECVSKSVADRIKAQFAAFAGVPVKDDDKKDVATFWVRARNKWPDLAELMLFWLTFPISTSDVERGFSFQTMIDQDTRRRCLKPAQLRCDLLAHIYKDTLLERANAALNRRDTRRRP